MLDSEPRYGYLVNRNINFQKSMIRLVPQVRKTQPVLKLWNLQAAETASTLVHSSKKEEMSPPVRSPHRQVGGILMWSQSYAHLDTVGEALFHMTSVVKSGRIVARGVQDTFGCNSQMPSNSTLFMGHRSSAYSTTLVLPRYVRILNSN